MRAEDFIESGVRFHGKDWDTGHYFYWADGYLYNHDAERMNCFYEIITTDDYEPVEPEVDWLDKKFMSGSHATLGLKDTIWISTNNDDPFPEHEIILKRAVACANALEDFTDEQVKEGKFVNLNKRESELITTGLYILESACLGDELDHELADDLGGTPNDEDVRLLMGKIKLTENR